MSGRVGCFLPANAERGNSRESRQPREKTSSQQTATLFPDLWAHFGPGRRPARALSATIAKLQQNLKPQKNLTQTSQMGGGCQ